MKIKLLLLFLLFLIISQVSAQRDMPFSGQTDISVNALHFSVDSVEELQEIDWVEIRDLFRDNTPEEPIELGFLLKRQVKRETYTMDSFEFTIKGKTEEVESIISKTQKIILSLSDTD
ncbi:hypothetical protein ACA086_01185 [Muriicola sp. E247]|uniref:hypothetical protein n=1 Tax=unclassified Muriicola TaxID=2647561 RepID=UPI00351094BB